MTDDWFDSFLTVLRPELKSLEARTLGFRVLGRFHRYKWKRKHGWYTTVASLGSGIRLMVWLDRYLEADGSAHLGVWLHSRPAEKTQIVAERFRGTRGAYLTITERDRSARESITRPSLRRAGTDGAPLLDIWPSGDAYFGWYVDFASAIRPALAATRPVMNAVREMLDVLGIESTPARLASSEERLRKWAKRLDRSGQGRFRAALLDAFGGRCCISGYDAPDALEAAHIVAVRRGTDAPENGLLLRVDLHRLFDLGLLQIRGTPPKVWIAPPLRSSAYGALHGSRLQVSPGADRLKALRERGAAAGVL